MRATLAALAGDGDAASRAIRATEASRRAFGHYHHAQYDVACVLARTGDLESALDWLRAAATNGYPCAFFFELDPLLAPLRGLAGYREIIDFCRAESDACREVWLRHRPVSDSAAPPTMRQS
jgi:hypothetical protein